MTNLKVLNASGQSGISQNSIDCLDLYKLDSEDNPKITTKSFTKLVVDKSTFMYDFIS